MPDDDPRFGFGGGDRPLWTTRDRDAEAIREILRRAGCRELTERGGGFVVKGVGDHEAFQVACAGIDRDQAVGELLGYLRALAAAEYHVAPDPEDGSALLVRRMSDTSPNDPGSLTALFNRMVTCSLPAVARRLGLHLIANLTGSGDGEVGVVLRRGKRFILKTQEGGLDELILLFHAYAELGIACPRIIDTGDQPLPWVLMTYEPGRPTTVTDARQRLGQATRLLRQLHAVTPHRDTAWFERYAKDVADIYANDRIRGDYPGPDPAEITQRLTYTRPVQLHGDWVPVNTLIRDDDTFVVLDPVGFVGPAEYDIATWCVIGCGEPNRLIARLHEAADAYGELDFEQLILWATLDCLDRARNASGKSPARWGRTALRLLQTI